MQKAQAEQGHSHGTATPQCRMHDTVPNGNAFCVLGHIDRLALATPKMNLWHVGHLRVEHAKGCAQGVSGLKRHEPMPAQVSQSGES